MPDLFVSLRTAPIVAALALTGTVAGAQARPDSARADSARRLQSVVVTESRQAATVGGASAIVIEPQALRTSPAPLLEEALRQSPFVLVRQNSRGEMELSVRGSDSRQAAVLLDGVPLTLGWDHRADPSLIPVTGVDDITIVRGLGTLLAGPNTLGGVIELGHDQLGAVSGAGSSAWLGSSIDEHASHVLTGGARHVFSGVGGGRLALRGGIAHRQREGFALAGSVVDPAAEDGLRSNSDLRQTDGFASLRWSGAAGRALGLTISGFEAERGVPPELHLQDPRLWRYPYQSRVVAALSGRVGTFVTPFGWGGLEVGAGFNAGRSRIDVFDDTSYRTVIDRELGDERTWTARALLTHSLPASAQLKTAVTLADVSYSETLAPDPAVAYRQRLWSAGSEVELPLGSATSLATGIVYDRASTPETGGRAPQPPLDAWGFRAGLTRDVGTETRLHASVSRRSRFPALRELYSGALDRFEPNPELKPETLTGFEAGITLDRELGPIPDVTLQAIGFHHRLDDAVVRVTQPDRRFKRVNRDRIESTGAELLAGLALGADRERALSLTGDLTLQRVQLYDVTTAGTPSRHAENNPGTRGMLELGVPLPLQLRGFANARYTGTQYCLNAETDAEVTLGAQHETDLALERKWSLGGRGLFRTLRALVAIDNVGDATVYDICGMPQPGRTLRFGIELR